MSLCRVQEVSSYLVIPFDPLHKLRFVIFNSVSKVTVSYFSSDRLWTGDGKVEEDDLLKYVCRYPEGLNCGPGLSKKRRTTMNAYRLFDGW